MSPSIKYVRLLSLLSMLLSIVTYKAQIITNDGLALTVQTGLVATIQGGYTNKTNAVTSTLGSIDNAGEITLTGDWTNIAANTVFTTNTGLVTILGTTAAQTIGGTNSTGFYNLTTNNTFAISPQIILGLNQTVKNTLTMTAGNINLAGFTKTLGTAPASPGALVHSATAASGWMYGGNFARYFDAATVSDGSLAGLFPMGTVSGEFRPFYLTAPAVAPTTGDLNTVSHTDATTIADVSFPDGASTVVRRHDAFWTLTPGAALTGGTYNLRGEGTGYGTIGAVADLRLTLIGSVVGTAGVNAGTTAQPIVNRTGLTLAELTNNFYIGSVDKTNSPLPIELIEFTGKCDAENVVLSWKTASELNNDYFTIEKSNDGENWMDLTKVKGAGNSLRALHYSYTDSEKNNSFNYYRLKQTDYNREFHYSDIIYVEGCIDKKLDLHVYPNPSTGNFNLELIGEKEPVLSINVYNALGEKVYQSNKEESSINLNDKPNGVYFIYLNLNSKSFVKQIILQR